MSEQILWLKDVQSGHWLALGAALRAGLPVPSGFLALHDTPEKAIRRAYEDLKLNEYTHYLAVRSPSHALIDVIGTDQIIHTLRRLWMELPGAEVLVQAMVNSTWCGTAAWEGKNLRIRAAEGLQCLDSDMYLFNTTTRKCTRRTLYQRPRKVFRAVDGTTRTMEIIGERRPLEPKYLEAIAVLAERAESDVTWVLDDRRVWLIGKRTAETQRKT
jgi:hypothetical protein